MESKSDCSTERYMSPNNRDQRDEVPSFSLEAEFRDDGIRSDITDSVATNDNVDYNKSLSLSRSSERSKHRSNDRFNTHSQRKSAKAEAGPTYNSRTHIEKTSNRAGSNSFLKSPHQDQGTSTRKDGSASFRNIRKRDNSVSYSTHHGNVKKGTAGSRSTLPSLPTSTMSSRSLSEADGFNQMMNNSFEDSLDSSTFSKIISADFSLPGVSQGSSKQKGPQAPHRTLLHKPSETKSSNSSIEMSKSARINYAGDIIKVARDNEEQLGFPPLRGRREGGSKARSRGSSESLFVSINQKSPQEATSKRAVGSLGTTSTERNSIATIGTEQQTKSNDGSASETSRQSFNLHSTSTRSSFSTKAKVWQGADYSQVIRDLHEAGIIQDYSSL